MVRRVKLANGTIPAKEQQVEVADYREQLQNYNSNDHVLNMNGFMNLREGMGFEQMRFYCHKKIPGIVFHVATKTNSLGEAVIQYFTGKTTTPPQTCDSFSTFPDDTSTLSLKCAEWGAMNANPGSWEKKNYCTKYVQPACCVESDRRDRQCCSHVQ